MAVRGTIFGPVGKPSKGPKPPSTMRRIGATGVQALGTAAGAYLGNPALGSALGSAVGSTLFKAPSYAGVADAAFGGLSKGTGGAPKASPVPAPARRSAVAPGVSPVPPRYSMEGRLDYRRPGSAYAPRSWRYEPAELGAELLPFVKKPVRFGLEDLFGPEESPYFEPLRRIFR